MSQYVLKGDALAADAQIYLEKAGTATGRAIGSTVGHNLAAYTAELGGKVWL
jgi:acyl-CoA reductase-like NAD-dependent aldehyde dehydrogenase